MAKRFSKNMIRRIALSGDVANAYALGRTMQEKHTPFVNASAVQVYGDGTRLHTLKSGSYRRLYATGGGQERWQQCARIANGSDLTLLLLDTDKKAWYLGRIAASQGVNTWQPLLHEYKFKQVVGDWYAIFMLTTNGEVFGFGESQADLLGVEDNNRVWPPVQLTPYSDWYMLTAEYIWVVLGIRQDGTLWGWGDNFWGTVTSYAASVLSPSDPAQVLLNREWLVSNGYVVETDAANLRDDDWIWVDMSFWNTVAVKKDGSIWVWGRYHDEWPRPITTVPKRQLKRYSVWPYKPHYGNGGSFVNFCVFGDGNLYWKGDANIYGTARVATDWTLLDDAGNWDHFVNDWDGGIGVKTNGAAYVYLTTYIDPTGVSFFPTPKKLFGNWRQWSVGFLDVFLGIRDDGTLWGLGSNAVANELGLGPAYNYENQPEPVQIGTDNDWAWVDTYYWMSVARKKNGDTYFWGFIGYVTPEEYYDIWRPLKFTPGEVILDDAPYRNDGR